MAAISSRFASTNLTSHATSPQHALQRTTQGSHAGCLCSRCASFDSRYRSNPLALSLESLSYSA